LKELDPISKEFFYKNNSTEKKILPWPTKTFGDVLAGSVADPDPHVFGPPGSGPISQRYGSGSFYHHVKIVRKTLIPTIL
jgi:hypothetical protein